MKSTKQNHSYENHDIKSRIYTTITKIANQQLIVQMSQNGNEASTSVTVFQLR